MSKIKTVLFDLDGTLADTAPDLAAALNHVLETHNRKPLPYETIRPAASHGGTALLNLGFGKEHPKVDILYQELIHHYFNNIANQTTLFPGMSELLLELEEKNITWGIVTNKPTWLTDPLVKALNLSSRAVSIVSGDTLKHNKPHPDPILYACKQAKSKPSECIYIGDAERDIKAGNAAGMPSIIALFGYIADSDTPEKWGAHASINHPREILSIIQSLNEQ